MVTIEQAQRQAKLRRSQEFRRAQAQRQQARTQTQAQIDRLRADIQRIKDNLARAQQKSYTGKKYKGSRARKVWNNRIKGREAAIKFLQENIGKGFNTQELLKAADQVRLGTTRQLEKQRLKQFTAGSRFGQITKATTGVKILSGKLSKDFQRVPLTTKQKTKTVQSLQDLSLNRQKSLLNLKDPSMAAFKEAGVGGIGKVLTKAQRETVLAAAGLTTFIPAPAPEFKAPKISKLERTLARNVKDGKVKQISKGVASSLVDTVKDFVDLGKMIVKGELTPTMIPLIVKGSVEYGRQTLTNLASGQPYDVAKSATDIALFFIPVTKIKAKVKIANSKTKWNSKTDIRTGKTRITLDTTGLTQANQNFIQKAKLTYNPKTKKVTGTVESNIGKQKTKERVELIDERGFYVDKKTGIKIPKQSFQPTDVKVNIKEIKSTQKTGDNTIIKGNLEAKTGTRNITTRDIAIAEKGTKRAIRETVRGVELEFLRDLQQANKVLATKIKARSPATKITSIKRFQKTYGLTDNQVKKFLESIGYRKDIIKGIDRRTRIARALGLRKENKVVKQLETIIDEEGATIITRKGKIRASGVVEEINPILARLGLSNPKLSKTGKLTKGQLDEITKVGRKLEVPDLKVRLREIKKLRPAGLITATRLSTITKKINSRITQLDKSKVPLRKPAQKQIPKTKQVPAKVTKRVQTKKTKQAPRTTTKTITKSKLKPTPVSKARPARPVITKEKIIKLKLPKLSFDSKKLDNKVLTFTGNYRERKDRLRPVSKSNPVITKTLTIKDTKNRALKKVANLVDRRAARSLTLRVTGIGKSKKDINKPSELRKFTTKKSTGTPVLRLVEKPKYALDKKSEQRELKSLKKKTTKKTKKSSKKSSKSAKR